MEVQLVHKAILGRKAYKVTVDQLGPQVLLVLHLTPEQQVPEAMLV
jgi:hypothetical protein